MKIKNYIIAAHDLNFGIGFKNQLPWNLKNDMKFFKDTTFGHSVIMGRNTYESIGKPLPGRLNIVLSRDRDYCDNLNRRIPDLMCTINLNGALNLSAETEKRFFIGGASLYQQALDQDLVDEMYITIVKIQSKVIDTYFPHYNMKEWNRQVIKEGSENKINYTIMRLYK